MQDYKSMTIPMTTNLKKLCDSATCSKDVDPTQDRQLIGSLMYLVHTRPIICYTVNALSQFMFDPKHMLKLKVRYIFITSNKLNTRTYKQLYCLIKFKL